MSNEQSEHEKELWQRAKDFDGIPRAESYHELSKIAFEREEYPEALNMCLIAKEIFQSDHVYRVMAAHDIDIAFIFHPSDIQDSLYSVHGIQMHFLFNFIIKISEGNFSLFI